jgi:ABA4-like protein
VLKEEAVSPHHIFSIANFVALCCWLLLVVLPGKKWVAHTVAGLAVPAAFAAVYSVIVLVYFAGAEGGFSSLGDVAALFASSPWILLAGWIHYLAFDLLVGTWEARDSRERGVPHLLLVPCLILTFLFGPAGWLLYLGVRSLSTRSAGAAVGSSPA